jgi:uncharacterized protein
MGEMPWGISIRETVKITGIFCLVELNDETSGIWEAASLWVVSVIELNSALVVMLVALLIAGFLHGLTGFGFSLVATPLLSLVITVKEASTLVLFFIVFTCFVSLYRLRRGFRWKWSWDYVIGLLLGVIAGVYILVKVDEVILKRMLGFTLLCISIQEVFLSLKYSKSFLAKCGFPLAFVSGALAGAFNMGGPPAVVYAYAQPWSKEEVIVQLQIIFLISSLLRLLFVGFSGTVNSHLGALLLIGSVPVLLGIVLGQKYFHVLPEKKVRQIVFVTLAFLGIKFLVWS